MPFASGIDGDAVRVLDARDQAWSGHAAAIRKSSIGSRQLEKCDLAGTESERRYHRQLRFDPETLRVVHGRTDADLLEKLGGCTIARKLERGAQGVLRLFVSAAGKPLLVA